MSRPPAKVTEITLIIWGAITLIAAFVYVFLAWRWGPIDAEYETRPDYRLAFFAIGMLPRLFMLLAGTLAIEWIIANIRLHKRERTKSSTPPIEGHTS